MPLHGEYADPIPGSMPAQQLAEIDAAGGDTHAVSMGGMDIVVFTVRGARSGKLRRVPLMRVEHDGEYAAVASKGGAPEHPAWYANMLANPHVMLRDGVKDEDFLVHEAQGEERDQWWERAVAAFPNYAQYQANTERRIPVLVARPMTADEAAASAN